MKKLNNTLPLQDLSDIPIELYKELSKPKQQSRHQLVINIINDAGGESDINTILISLFRSTKEIVKRKSICHTLTRMIELGYLERSDKKSHYKVIKK